MGQTFSIAASAQVKDLTVSDDDGIFDNGDLSQNLNSSVSIEGSNYSAASGRMTPEYAYTVKNAATGETFTVYAFEMSDNDMVGLVSTKPMVPGTTYTVVDCSNDCPSVAYSSLATYPKLDGIVEGTAGADLIDASYLGDPEGDKIDANDARFPGMTGNDDSIQAGAGNDTIRAGAGNDRIDGGAGNDLMEGGAGNDTYIGGTGLDVVDYSGSSAAVNVNLQTNTLSGGAASGDVIAGGVDGRSALPSTTR